MQAHAQAQAAHAAALLRFLERAGGRALVLSGAGISTDSGIPDYRGPRGVYVRNKDFRPLQFREFVGAHAYRQRYWARSFLGWPRIQRAQPNAAHLAVAALQAGGLVGRVLTQNVDRLHAKAGARRVLELHGSLHEVECQACGSVVSRDGYQRELARRNPAAAQWAERHPGAEDAGDVASSVNPDGDVDISWDYAGFQYPACDRCGGLMKPRVVFFGENLPAATREQSVESVDDAAALLVVGSSLQVFSAMRLVRRARDNGLPVAILNLGPTRADDLCDLRIDAPCSALLAEVAGCDGLL